MRQTVSLNDITKIVQPTVFTCMPPVSYGSLLSDKKYKTKRFRQYMMSRFYAKLSNTQNKMKSSPKSSPEMSSKVSPVTILKRPSRSVSFCWSRGVFFHV